MADARTHGDDRGRSPELHPYFFHRDATDVLREAFTELLATRTSPRATTRTASDEEAVIREQRQALFAHDAPMQQLFDGDFEAFSAALDEPWRFDERFRRRLAGVTQRGGRPVTIWDGLEASARQWETGASDGSEAHGHAESEGDPVYERAFQWACRVERWGRRTYAAMRDRECYRVHANAALVPAKIAFGHTAAVNDDAAGFTTALVGYRQAAIFCLRILESLGSCYARRVGRPQTVHGFLDEGRDLLADIESRIAEIESELRFRRGHQGSA